MALTRRLVKGQALTSAEHDANIDHFENNPNGIYIPKASGTGIKIDETNPDWGWCSITSPIVLANDASDPSYVNYQGTIRGLQFSVGNNTDFVYQIPHDYAIGTDIHAAIVWSHNSATLTGGTATGNFEATYSKAHDQATFTAPIIVPLNNVPFPTARYKLKTTVAQLSASAGAGSLLVTEDLEPNGTILAKLELTALTDTGTDKPFLHTVYIQYQSTGVGTKQRQPPFYT